MSPRDSFILFGVLLCVLLGLVTGGVFLVPDASGGATDAEPAHTLATVEHDGHLLIVSAHTRPNHFLHHPDCPCKPTTTAP